MHVEPGCHGLVPDLAVALEGRLGEVDIEHAAGDVPDGLAHALGSFDEEASVLGPRVAAGEARHSGDAGRGRIAQHLVAGGRALADGAPPRPAGLRTLGRVVEELIGYGGVGRAHAVSLREQARHRDDKPQYDTTSLPSVTMTATLPPK